MSRRFLSLAVTSLALAVAACQGAPAQPSEPAPPAPEAAPAAEKPAATERPDEGATERPAESPTLGLSQGKAHATTAEDAVGTLEGGFGLAVGTTVPTWTASRHDGGSVTLDQLVADGPILLVFYRGGWCPYCNFQVRNMTLAAARFAEHGVTPVLVSPDRTDAATLARKTYEIPFPVLSDPDMTVHTAFKNVFTLDAAGYERLIGFGMDLEAWSGREHHRLGHPAAFLVDSQRVVRWAHLATDYKTRPSVDQLVAAVAAWRTGAEADTDDEGTEPTP